MRKREDIEKELSPKYILYENSYDSHDEDFGDYVKRILEIQTEILLDIREKLIRDDWPC